MPRIEPELQRLQDIKSLPSLIKYLKDDLHWPIESDDVDEVAFDYDPAELGFDSESTAKIEEVRQLRPLTTGQKWGIFWVKFSKKRLPVQMLRRALANLVVKKRASSRRADKAAWYMHDLLFISAYGDDSNRHVTFAHFAGDDDAGKSLPVLKVLGWDEEDTVLHLRDTYKTLLAKLDWEATPTDNPDAWRDQWSSAFKVGHREVINTTRELVVELAHLATVIKNSVLISLNAETDKGPWKKLMLAFKKSLMTDLDEKNPEPFADVIAQTISYGLLTARLSSDGQISLKNLVDMVPSTNPFLKELLQHFLTSAGMKGLFDVDEAGINDVVELLNRANAQAIRNDFGKKTDGEDPVIHFYEHFLGAYNKKLKVERGVFYTPKPVVSYIVRSIHALLQKEFGLEEGLADTSTWAEVKKNNKSLKIPEGIKPDIEPFVQILDPATGTATFLIEVIDVIHSAMISKWDRERIPKAEQSKKWNVYVPTHLLPRLYAYELMMAPYAIAHMKVGLKLTETGFTAWEKLGPENRANIFLTNALDPWMKQLVFPGINALAQEASAVNEVKKNKVFTVLIGNPPYSIRSGTMSDYASSLLEPFRYVNGIKQVERGALKSETIIQDDYVKFWALFLNKINFASFGVMGLVTNNGFIDNRVLRGMRGTILESVSQLYVTNLHGSNRKTIASASASADENVFDIKQGVAVSVGIKSTGKGTLHINDLIGSRDFKYAELSKSTASNSSNQSRICHPSPPYFIFEAQDQSLDSEYSGFQGIDELMPFNRAGFVSGKDDLVISYSRDELRDKIAIFFDEKKSNEEIRSALGIKDAGGYVLEKRRPKALSYGKEWDKLLIPTQYQPFDYRWVCYSEGILTSPQTSVMSHITKGENIALCFSRGQQSSPRWTQAFCTKHVVQHHSAAQPEINYVFPFRLFAHENDLAIGEEWELNLSKFAVEWCRKIGVDLSDLVSFPGYIYAITYSQSYRLRYQRQLQRDFPRIPLTHNTLLFARLKSLGENLLKLHTLEFSEYKYSKGTFSGSENTLIESVSWSDNTVWIDSRRTSGFRGVSIETWSTNVGGYLPCEKWLKNRKGRKLTKEDIEHYLKIVTAISETNRLMAEIDKAIDEHGGWPGAFQTKASS